MIYLDIETACVAWADLSLEMQALWAAFARNKYRDEGSIRNGFADVCWEDKASLHPEFGLVVCVSYAIDDGEINSLTAAKPEDEKELLKRFANVIDHNFHAFLCAHNGKGFDFHWLARRMVIHGIHLPHQLNTQGKKPWETAFVDTQEMWGFGDLRRTVRLDVLCSCLGVESPKDAMCGSEVPAAWREGRIDEIRVYCEKDVKALREVYQILEAA